MIPRALDEITEVDLAGLVSSGVAEGRSLEFKLEFPGGSDADTKEFLADATSLANSAGGDLIFGVADTDGVATAIPGLRGPSLDASILRLENLIRDGVQPRLSGIRTRGIALPSGSNVVVMRVPASFAGPHRIIFKNSGRFYARNSRGKYEMDTHELREAFTATEALPRRFRDLHGEAIRRSDGYDMPFSVGEPPRAVLTLAPVSLFRDRRDINFDVGHLALPPGLTGAFDDLISLEGTIIRSPIGADGGVRCYALHHRTGWIEAAWQIGRRLAPDERRGGSNAPELCVWPNRFEDGVEKFVPQAVGVLMAHEIEGPWIVQVSIRRLSGASMIVGDGYVVGPAWRAEAVLPELIIDYPPRPKLEPLYRDFWRLFGRERPR